MPNKAPAAHQFNLFGFNVIRPRFKVPISAERIREAKTLMAQGDAKGSAAKMREVREALEAFEARLTNNQKQP